MKDFIKDLNIIDFLGILLPGTLLILLFSSVADGWALWSAYFGSDCSETTKIIILLVAGYALGALIHEVGDIAEKCLWLSPCFDPKVYAARAVGAEKLCASLGRQMPAFQKEETAGFRQALCFKLQLLMDIQPGEKEKGSAILYRVLCILIGVGLHIAAFKGILLLGGLPGHWLWVYIAGLAAAAVLVSVLSPAGHPAALCAVSRANPDVQTALVKRGNDQKRILFDGFHVMARNFWFVSGIIGAMQNVFSLSLVPPFLQMPRFSLCFILFFAVLRIRYWHYSYLRYKYSFEDYLVIKAAEK